ncbi:metabotropic GABA-B receptor subtype 3, partial [Carabus blaptoides fortunei]
RIRAQDYHLQVPDLRLINDTAVRCTNLQIKIPQMSLHRVDHYPQCKNDNLFFTTPLRLRMKMRCTRYVFAFTGGTLRQCISRALTNKKTKNAPELRAFALTLNIYSLKAY